MNNGKYIKQISDSLAREADRNLNNVDITFSQIFILMHLKDRETQSATYKEIEKIMKVSQPAIVGLANRLEAKGYAVSYMDHKDKRVKHLKVTEKGVEICKHAEEDLVATEERLVHALDEKQREQFSQLLKTVAESLE